MFKSKRVFTVLLCVLFVLLNLTIVSAQEMTYQQAPYLDGMDLPPVAERLPINPRIVDGVDGIGEYGGTWRMGTRGGGDEVIYVRTVGYHNLVRWSIDWTEVIPDVAESFEINDEGTVFTFYLREGMRWSDGAPFTADDILFAFNDIYLNPEVFPAPPTWLVSGDAPVVVEKIDDYTFRCTFAAPNGMFMQQLATPNASTLTAMPKHYLSQFHASYAEPEDLEELMAEAGVELWTDLFNQRGGSVAGKPNTLWSNADLPTIYPYEVVDPLGPNATQVRLVRNPYFYVVDSAGNQLPYIDEVVYNVGQDVETLVLQALNGEIDMQDRHIASNANRAVFFDNQEAGDYRFFETVPSSSNVMVISLNLTHLDPAKREIYQNIDFRIGLSHAIDRQEIIDVVYIGQGSPAQAAPRPESPFYDEEMTTQYTEFDPDLANEYLDRVVPERDAEGFRLMPSGERLVISMEVIATLFPEWPDVLELIQGYWADVGIQMELVVEDRSLFYDRKAANQHDAAIWGGDGGLDVMLEPRWYFPNGNESNYGEAWQYWYNNPNDERAEEPPEIVRQQMDLYNQLKSTADPERQFQLMTQILDIAKEQFYTIGISLTPNGYGIVRNNMHNVPASILNAYLYPSPGPTNTFTYYFSDAN